MEIDFYLNGNLELFIMACTLHWPLCCPIRSYYSEAVSEKVMVSDVKHDSEMIRTHSAHMEVFVLSVIFVS